MLIKEKFISEVVEFNVDGISMIGNNLSGQFVGLSKDGETFVDSIIANNQAEVTPETEELYKVLKRGNYFLKDMNKETNHIVSAYLHVTDNCNLHCVGCYSYVDNRNCKSDLSLESIYREIDQLAKNGVRFIVISGGEPFIRDDIDLICKHVKECGMLVQIITNGTMPRTRYVKALQYIDAIAVSVDGYNEKTTFIRDQGIMPKVLDCVKFLKENGANIKLIYTLHKKNVNYIEQYIEQAQKLGVLFSFSMLTVSKADEVMQDYILDDSAIKVVEEYLMKHKIAIMDSPMESINLVCKTRCGAGKLLVSVAADGTVYPCHMLHIPELSLGNVIEKDLEEIGFTKDNPFLDLDVNHIKGCEKCKHRYFCGGGCRARSYLETGSIYDKSDICTVSYKTINNKFERLTKQYGLGS